MSEKSNIFEALAKFQEKVGIIAKNAKGQKGHRHFTYADLPAIMDQIQPLLTECSLAVCQGVDHEEGNVSIACMETTICHWPSGETINKHFPFTPNSDPQEAGKEITYYRRYGILGILNLVTDDDVDKPRAAPKARPAGAQRQRTNSSTSSTSGTSGTSKPPSGFSSPPEPTGDKTKFHRTDYPCPNCNVTVFWSPKDKYPATYTCWKKADPDPGCGWKGLDPTVKPRSSTSSAAQAVADKTGSQYVAEVHAKLDAIAEALEQEEPPDAAGLLEQVHKISEELAESESYKDATYEIRNEIRERWRTVKNGIEELASAQAHGVL